jgi:hypothetical protein
MNNTRDRMNIFQALQIFRLLKDRYQLFEPVLLISHFRKECKICLQVQYNGHGLYGR